MVTMTFEADGRTLFVKASWALNTTRPGVVVELCGTKAGAQIKNKELILNYDKDDKLMDEKPIEGYEGTIKANAAVAEARQWIDAILNDTDPCVLPEQACVVSEILEAIYESAETGKPVYFD